MVTLSLSAIAQLRDMFPSVPKAEIERVLIANNGNVEDAIIALLN